MHIAVMTKNKENPAYVGAQVGVNRLADQFGFAVRHYVPETPDDIDEQRVLIGEALAAGPAAIAIAPTHPTALDDALAPALAAKIPLFGFINPFATLPCVTFVGSDDHAIGVAIAERLFQHLGGRGDIAIIEGSPNAPTAVARHVGFRDAIARHPGIREIASARGDFHREPAYRAMSELLRQHAKIDGVLVTNDLMAFGVIEAMREAGRQIPIVSVNATPEGVAAVKGGDMVATAAFNAMGIACLAVLAAHRHLTGKPVPPRIMLPVEIVDADHIRGLDQGYADRPLPEWDAVVPPASRAAE